EDGPLARERDMRRYLVRGYERARQDHAVELESLRGRLIALDRLFTASGLELDAPSRPHQRALQGLARAGKAPSLGLGLSLSARALALSITTPVALLALA